LRNQPSANALFIVNRPHVGSSHLELKFMSL
jgi:hypothetical protein